MTTQQMRKALPEKVRFKGAYYFYSFCVANGYTYLCYGRYKADPGHINKRKFVTILECNNQNIDDVTLELYLSVNEALKHNVVSLPKKHGKI